MNIAANIFSIFGALIIMLCALGYLRNKNIFIPVKLVFIANIYGLSFLMIGFMLNNLSAILSIKITLLILFNILITIIINHIIVKQIKINQ
ncbi:MAG: multisubunit Na+/H+ antiporter MnhG subunit [Rickettsiales bacterium]|jgi:multisubunit Na+/H+ antiporter MnhG subunit